MECIQVSVRVRPQLPDGEAREAPSCVELSGSDTIHCGEHDFRFGRVFGPKCTTAEVYAGTVGDDLVAAVCEGRNATVFAYGQSGSGKTHTLLGSSLEPGIEILAVRDIFASIASAENDKSFLVRSSYIELYNEKIRDLLVEGRSEVKIVNHPQQGPSLKGATEIVSTGIASILDLIAAGEAQRSYGSTGLNATSSRSHVVLRLQLESKRGVQGTCTSQSLYLVDLAGSERNDKVVAGGHGGSSKLMRESANINKSLLTLGIVIRELSDAARVKRKAAAVRPSFRSSKLTRLLQNALGGNSRTFVICAVRQDADNADETLSTLRFAARCRTVATRSKVNVVHDRSVLIDTYEREIESLRSQLREAKAEASQSQKASVPQRMAKVALTVAAKRRQEAAAANAKLDALERMVMRSSSSSSLPLTGRDGEVAAAAKPGVAAVHSANSLHSESKARLRWRRASAEVTRQNHLRGAARLRAAVRTSTSFAKIEALRALAALAEEGDLSSISAHDPDIAAASAAKRVMNSHEASKDGSGSTLLPTPIAGVELIQDELSFSQLRALSAEMSRLRARATDAETGLKNRLSTHESSTDPAELTERLRAAEAQRDNALARADKAEEAHRRVSAELAQLRTEMNEQHKDTAPEASAVSCPASAADQSELRGQVRTALSKLDMLIEHCTKLQLGRRKGTA